MPRTHPERPRQQPRKTGQIAALIALASGALAGIPLAAANLFDSDPVDKERFAVLAQAVGEDRWKLLVLEQIKARPLCWEERNDGLVKPSLNQFNFAGVCRRYLDSNGYSLRTGESDMAASFRLKVEADSRGLSLFAIDSKRNQTLLIARSTDNRRDRNAFVRFDLEPDWHLERRSYRGRALNHVYFAHPDSAEVQLARVQQRETSAWFAMSPPPPPSNVSMGVGTSGPIRLQVIPFRP
ncbi:MAG: DUF3747 domain-containing protein [Synechococcus sp.]